MHEKKLNAYIVARSWSSERHRERRQTEVQMVLYRDVWYILSWDDSAAA